MCLHALPLERGAHCDTKSAQVFSSVSDLAWNGFQPYAWVGRKTQDLFQSQHDFPHFLGGLKIRCDPVGANRDLTAVEGPGAVLKQY